MTLKNYNVNVKEEKEQEEKRDSLESMKQEGKRMLGHMRSSL